MRQTDLDKAPYFDDHNPLKQFHQVLFKAGTTVQSRELNELQDILQGQVEAIGSHLFKNGSVVIPGTFNTQTKLISLALIVDETLFSTLNSLSNVYVKGTTSGVEAKVTTFASVDSSKYVFCEITKSGPNGETKNFSVEPVSFVTFSSSNVETTVGAGAISSIGLGSFATVDDGIYYVRGMMVRVERQTIILSPTVDVSVKVGFNVSEEIISALIDDDLYSNALNYPNYRSSGADRLKVTLTLETRAITQEDANFLELARIVDGNVESLLSEVQYNELEKILAQRTYEESGDYTVTQSSVELREHLQDGDNGGVYPSADGGDENKLVAVVGPSVHYVKGYRVENSTPRLVTMNKSRDTDISNNAVTASIFGNCVEVVNCLGVPFVDYNVTYNILNASSSVIGTFRVASIQKQGTDSFHLLARRVRFTGSNVWANAVSISATKGAVSFKGALASKGLTLGGYTPSLILNLPFSGVKSLETTGVTDTTYSVMNDFSVVLNSSGIGFVNAPSGSVFTGQFSQNSVSTTTATVGEIPVVYTLSGTPAGTFMQIDAGAGFANQTVHMAAVLQKTSSAPRSKRRTRAVSSISTSPSVNTYTLPNCDGIRLIAVTLSGEDYTDSFAFDGGQRDASYELITIKTDAELPVGTASIEYEYFAHGPGDYFCVDSYSEEAYDDIPSYTSTNSELFKLSDCLDFRKSSTTDGITYVDGATSQQFGTVQSDIEFYLPRFSALFVTPEGNFGVSEGISSQNPEIPLIPENSMRLSDFFIPPWTPDLEQVLRFPVNNKRYTMRDIGKLETRIETVEYYTSLSQLEASSNNIQVIDPVTGNDRFKNGIFADPMNDFRLFNPEDPESFASIDDVNGRLRPMVDTIGVNMVHSSGGLVRDDMVSATILGEIVFTNQPFATRKININPYAVFTWAGFVNLNPSRDFWVDTVYAKPKIINQTENHRGAAKAGVVYGQWSSLQGGAMAFRFSQQRQVTTTTFTEWSTSTTSETTLKTELIPYMRTIDIAFSASGLRPFTRVYPWFSNKNVSAYCRTETGSMGGSLVTDASGSLKGVFRVPNTSSIRFSTGVGSFVLVDNATNPDDSLNRTTFATVKFESGGRLVTKQKTTVQTRHLGSTTRTELEYRKVDPIAQSFTVEESGGLLLKGVDIFFASKAKSLPITMEIRGMENGLPTHEVLARKTLNPSSVVTSFNADVATRFEIEPFCFLSEGTEYAIVLLANTQEYEAYIAQMGERVINSTATVAVQPHTGVFFTSSNGSTWSPQQTQDMKFRLVRANFNTSEQFMYFKPSAGAQGRFLSNNPVTSAAGSSTLTLNIPFHGSKAGDNITLSGLEGSFGIETSDLNRSHLVTEVVDFNTVKVQAATPATFSGQFGGASGFSVSRNIVNLVNVNVDHTKYEGTELGFEFRYRKASSRVISDWVAFTPGTDVLLPEEGSFYDTSDFEIRATAKATNGLSPMIDVHGFTVIMNAFYISETEDLMTYVSRDIYLDNPSTSGKLFVTSLLTTGSSLRLFVQFLNGQDAVWTEIQPVNPITPSSTSFTENEFDFGDVNEFIGTKIKLVIRGPSNNPPVIKDIRGVLLA